MEKRLQMLKESGKLDNTKSIANEAIFPPFRVGETENTNCKACGHKEGVTKVDPFNSGEWVLINLCHSCINVGLGYLGMGYYLSR